MNQVYFMACRAVSSFVCRIIDRCTSWQRCGLLAATLPVGSWLGRFLWVTRSGVKRCALWGETLWGETFWCETLWGETLWCETLCCEALWCDTLWGETRLGPRNKGEGHGKPKMNILILRFE